jgi:hypothetical protein
MIYILIAVVLLLCAWVVFHQKKRGLEKAYEKSKEPVLPNGIGPCYIQPADMERASCAERAFARCRYTFWNDIYGFGSTNANAYNTPEELVMALYKGSGEQNSESIVETVLANWFVIPLYTTMLPFGTSSCKIRDISIWAGTGEGIRSAEELAGVMEVPDPEQDRFLGLVYISREDALASKGLFTDDPDANDGWRDIAGGIVNSEICQFEKNVEEMANEQ